jgi:hypothetical protein
MNTDVEPQMARMSQNQKARQIWSVQSAPSMAQFFPGSAAVHSVSIWVHLWLESGGVAS